MGYTWRSLAQANSAWGYEERNVAYWRSRTAPAWICLGEVTTLMAEPGLPGDHRRKRRDPEARSSARASCGAASIPNSHLDLEAASNLSRGDGGRPADQGSKSWHRLPPQCPRLPLQCPRDAVPVGRGKLHSDHNLTSTQIKKSTYVPPTSCRTRDMGRRTYDQRLKPSANQWPVDPGDEEVCIKESGDLNAEDVVGHLAVLPEVTPTTEEVKIEDIQVGNPNDNTQGQIWEIPKRLPNVLGRLHHSSASLKLLRQKAMEKLRSWPNHEFLHVKRDWNQSADKLACAALQREAGEQVISQIDIDNLTTLNRLAELLVPQSQISVVKIAAITRSRQRRDGEVLQELLVQRMRMERIGRAQDEEKWIVDLKKYLTGDVRELTSTEAKSCAKIAEDYDIDEVGLLFYCPPSKQSCEDRDLVSRLEVPETLQEDVLHRYHSSLEGGHQGIGRTPTYKGNTELLIWIDLFTGYVIAKASASRTAQTIAENYEECVFRRFGTSEGIRHDREPGCIADFFRPFNKIVGQKQRATMAYRPQANGTAERMVQTLTRSVKMYVSDINQRDEDEYAERLTFALNTAQDRVRGDTPFYLMHGWDPRTTLIAMIPLGSTRRRDREPRRWRYHVQRHYQQAREAVNERLRDAIQSRADRHNESIRPYEIEVGMQVWLYLDRVKEGYARKLAHMWHGPFRVAAVIDTHAVRREIAGTEYRQFPIVHTSKLKPVRNFPDRPEVPLVIEDQDRFDFDEALLPEASWDTSLAEGEYEVERIADMRSGRRTRYGRTMREFLVHWKGYQEPTWVDEADLDCGALSHDYLRRQANQHRFNAMQSHEEA
ncbi:unnamed protein product [Phytophthora fragariaefolia]|uniref:Unnamed protein product n=1 Tax=Phytophthora fragariaefolia TaxID=1490495 RepID=A0A9W6U9F4_9STRA|nr:unnamed protein product [Phytophthora fragariaefolia]